MMQQSPEKILSFDSLKIGYVSGKHKNILLPKLDASALKGELIAVIGRNGIGKSTLLRTITGLQHPISGEINYFGRNLNNYSRIDLAQIVGYISTEVVKVNNMSVYDLVSLGRYPHTNWIGKINAEHHKVIIDALIHTGIENMSKRYINELSDGERQRVMIARLIAQDAGIMIMDEPTAFLDIGNKFEILQLLHSLARNHGKTVIFSTHDLHLAINKADKVWLMLDDKLLEGAPEDLIIQGSFDHLFDPSPMKFDPEHGTFSTENEYNAAIYIEGDGPLRYWTEKAIKRSGYIISELKTTNHILIPDSLNSCWKLVTDNKVNECSSLYDLLLLLKTVDRTIV